MDEVLKNLLYILQLEEYNLSRFLEWTKKHKKRKHLERKKKIVWTPKARVIFLLSFVFNLLTMKRKPVLAIQLATSFLKPAEILTRIFFSQLAKIKLKRKRGIIVIGITGSFGKTSTKEILYQILKRKYKVLKTPRSYNTPLGIAQIILKKLKKEHQIFLVEMGAYKIGEIRQLCNLTRPTMGILTGITLQHLERFKKAENIIKAKFELPASLPKDGLCLVNIDSLPQNQHPPLPQETIFYGIEKKSKSGKFILGKDINLYPTKTTFLTETNIAEQLDGERFETPLLGRHSVLNILPGIILGFFLQIELTKIKEAVKNLHPIPHRLEIIKKGGNIIIDDSYSANPEGVKSAFSLLALFRGRTKVIITPGLIELGEKQFEENLKVGEMAGQKADYVIFVGQTNKKPLLKGGEKFKKLGVNLFWVPNLQKAVEKLQEISLPKAVILFENDLPDQYF